MKIDKNRYIVWEDCGYDGWYHRWYETLEEARKSIPEEKKEKFILTVELV